MPDDPNPERPAPPARVGGRAHLLRGLAPLHRAVRPGRGELSAGACPPQRPARAGAPPAPYAPQGEAYVDIELTPLRDAAGEQAWFVERMEPLDVARSAPAAEGLIGRSPAFRAMLGLVSRVGPSEASVLLLGESGTGKELVARAVHDASPRAPRPLVVVDCASLPESLFESEVFGHEKGAFTGAQSARPGLVEAAREIKSLMTESVGRVDAGSAPVDQAGATMREIVASIVRVSDIVGEISIASTEQSNGVAQIDEAVRQMDTTTQQNAALVEQSAAAADSLKSQARELVDAVARFRTEGRPTLARVTPQPGGPRGIDIRSPSGIDRGGRAADTPPPCPAFRPADIANSSTCCGTRTRAARGARSRPPVSRCAS